MPTDLPVARGTEPPGGSTAQGTGRGWIAGAAALAALTFATHAANFTFTFMGARLLTPGDFGTLTAMLGIVLIGMAPGMAVQALTATGTLGGPATIDSGVARRLALTIAGVVTVIMLALGPSLGTWHPLAVGGIAAAAGLLPLTGANEGLLQGRGQFTLLGTVLCTGAVVKLATGIAGMAATRAVWAAAVAIALGYGAQLALSHRLAGGLEDARVGVLARLSREVVTAVVMMGLLLVVIHLDAVIARLLLDDLAAGLYAVGATAMRIVFWAPQFVVLLLFPRLVTDARRRVIAASMAGLLAAGTAGTLMAAVLGPTLVPVVFGDEYAAIGSDLWRFAWLGTAAVGLQILALSDLATGRRDTMWIMTATVVTVVGVLVATAPADPVVVVTIVASIVTSFVVVGTGRRLMHATPNPQAPDQEGHQHG